jgi:hypothetical protein
LVNRLEKKPLDWSYLAGYFDANGSLREDKSGKGPRLRINSYSRHLLEEVRMLVDSGSISREQKPKGRYYRLDITGLEHVQRVPAKMSPFLHVKTLMGEEWLEAHERSVLLYEMSQQLRRLQSRLC